MVLTCFLFIQGDDMTAILSLRMDMQGQIEQPLQLRTIEEIRVLQENARTIIVFPTEWCGVYQVELPLLSDHKAREAIPFALEDHIAQSVAQVHFVFDKAHYREGCYSVVVIDKHIMKEWMAKLTDLGLTYDQITIDWFALNPGEGYVGSHNVLLHADAFQGVVSLDIWEHYEHPWSQTLQWQVFTDSVVLQEWSAVPKNTQNRYVWIADRLSNAKFLNLCQGDFQHATSQMQVKHKYKLAGILAGAWILSFIAIHIGLYLLMTHQTQKIDQQIVQSYRTFFPGAQKVISPKIKITQLLKQSQQGNNATLWSLLESLSLALAETQSGQLQKPHSKATPMVQIVQFQNQIITVMFHCDNFSALERIESFLKSRHVHVQQISAATENEQVVAKLELSL